MLKEKIKLNIQLFAEKTLEQILGDELYKQVTDKLGDNKIAIVSDGNWIPKDKFDNLNDEKKQYKEQVDTLNVELGKLQGKLKDNEGATETIENLKKQIADKETEMKAIRKSNAIKLEVLKANPNDVADILPHLKEETITIAEDGAITGLKEQLDALKENKAYLFKEIEPSGTGGSMGNGGKSKTGEKNPWSKEHFNLTEQGRIIRENPELAEQLKSAAN